MSVLLSHGKNKMKNKKKSISFGQAITIALIIFVLIALLVVIEDVLNKPEFTITKEVCEDWRVSNETLNNRIRGNLKETYNIFDRFRNLDCNLLKKYDLLNNSLICVLLEKEIIELREERDVLNNIYPFYDEVRCEQVEVDEIEIDRLYIDEPQRQVKGTSLPKKIDCGLEMNGRFYCSFAISKQDLTTEWLDKNCEKSEFNVTIQFEDKLHTEYWCGEYTIVEIR